MKKAILAVSSVVGLTAFAGTDDVKPVPVESKARTFVGPKLDVKPISNPKTGPIKSKIDGERLSEQVLEELLNLGIISKDEALSRGVRCVAN